MGQRETASGLMDWHRMASRCESPIEIEFWKALYFRFGLLFKPQVLLGQYRLDFGCECLKVAIEVDGHEHHKSRQARTADAQRERNITQGGWQVIRFTGSEVHRDSRKCADSVHETLKDRDDYGAILAAWKQRDARLLASA